MRTGLSYSIPAPTNGWNARDPLADMDPKDAIRLENIFPNTSTVDLRGGFRVHSTGLGAAAVQTLAEFSGPDGTRRLVACANNKIYNATTYDAAATDISNATAITVNKWQTVNFRSTLIMVNGTDQPRQYDGTSVTDATYTAATGYTLASDNSLICVMVYKSRLYFVQKDKASIWYGNVNEITGELSELAVGGLFQRGGYVLFTGTFTRDIGDSTDDLFVIVSHMGEVLIYSGDYPGALNWVIVGRYFLPIPIGRRAGVNKGSDFLIITEGGLISLGTVMQNAEEAKPITDRVNKPFRLAAQLYKSNFGWQVQVYPRGHYLAVNIPTTESTAAEQYVMNTETGAWTKFTGQNACCWGLLNEKLYFGGIDGKVYEADYGSSDNGSNIEADLKGAFNYLGDRRRNKRMTMARPLLISNGEVSFVFNVDVDFGNRSITDTITSTESTGSLWDAATWDVSEWNIDNVYTDDWYSINGIGRCVAPRLSGNFQNVTFALSAIDYIYEPGGLI